jgi:SAM-dependent methyltransferase
MSKKKILRATLLTLMLSFSIDAAEFKIQTANGPLQVKNDDKPLMENDPESLLVSRFIRKSDLKLNSVWDIPLRTSWWSRPHEYAWAMQFAGPDFVVLDAACGVSHPFKWYLADNCKETWACDTDPRLIGRAALIQETYDDLGEDAYLILNHKDYIFDKITLVKESIYDLPQSMPSFDRIFCISTLEHLKQEERVRVFENFARVLSPDGWLVLTVDYPEVTPEELSANAEKAGLVPVSAVEIGYPAPAVDILTNGYYSIYRCVYKHAK